MKIPPHDLEERQWAESVYPMNLPDQLRKMGVHVEVKCPSHHDPDISHTFSELCKDARIQWVQMSGSGHSIIKTPEEGWKENK